MKAQKTKRVIQLQATDAALCPTSTPCCPNGTDVAKAAAGTLFMASKLLSRYETDIGLDTQPMAELLNKAVCDWALKQGATLSDLDQALADLQIAAQGTRLGVAH